MEKKIGKKTVLLVTPAEAFLAPFMESSVNLALPSIGKELAMNAILLSWITAAYPLAAAIILVPMGRVADLYGRKKVFPIPSLLGLFASPARGKIHPFPPKSSRGSQEIKA